MTPYTVNDTPALRRRIDADLRHVVDTVRDGDPRLHALVLTGGFARGEGAVMDGAPQNDYDLIAVRRAGHSRRPYADMREQLESELGLHIDLAPTWAGRLRYASPSIFWYETALRGQVLWGEDDVLRRIPVRGVADIGRDEGLRLLVNRAAGLLLACGPSDHGRRIQSAKALLGALDARLLSIGRFPPSHRERWEVYEAMRRSGDEPSGASMDHDVMQWAFTFKTRPEAAEPMDADAIWQRAADAVLDAVPVALRHAGIKDLDQYARQDRWLERMRYWSSAGRIGARRMVAHPTSQVRAGTLRLLRDMRDGAEDAEGHPGGHLEALMPGQEPLVALDRLRQATWT